MDIGHEVPMKQYATSTISLAEPSWETDVHLHSDWFVHPKGMK